MQIFAHPHELILIEKTIMRQKLFYSTLRETNKKKPHKTKLVENCDNNGTENIIHCEDVFPFNCC